MSSTYGSFTLSYSKLYQKNYNTTYDYYNSMLYPTLPELQGTWNNPTTLH